MQEKSWEIRAKRREYGPASYPECYLYHTQDEAEARASDMRASGEYDTVHVIDRNDGAVRLKKEPTSDFARDFWAVLEDHPIY